MTESLFRREVLEARQASWLGGISLGQPLRLWMCSVAAGMVALSVLSFLLLGSYARRSTVAGQLVPAGGMSTLVAPASGVVASMDVDEGAQVRAGQRLAVITVPRSITGGGDTLLALEERLRRRHDGLQAAQSAQREQADAREAGLRSQLAAAGHELAQLEAAIATCAARIRIAHETLERLRQLEGKRYVSLLQIKQQESAALAQLGDMQALQRQATATRRMIAQLRQALAELPAQRRAADAGHARELAMLEQEQVETRARGELVLTAAVDGLVSAQLAKPGQSLQAGQPLLSVLPADGRLEAELLVPSRAIGFVAPGDAVLLRYQAFPYQKFGHQRGTVKRISRSALGPGELGVQDRAAEPFYRVTVALAQQSVTAFGRQEPLRPGMLLDADIQGERRRLVEWVFEPLFSLKGRVGGG